MALVLTLAVRSLKEELHQLQESGSYVGEVIKVMGKDKVLVKVPLPPPSSQPSGQL
jgi:ATP-dependent 26S proteasome regulatory subunit